MPQQLLADGDVDFAIAWVPKALATREAGANIVDIAQIFQRSGTLQVSFADKGITTPADFKGKNIGNWGFGNEFEIFAALSQAGLDPATDVNLVQQQFNMIGLLDGYDRRRRGDDLQRVRPGARGREPRHRRAVHSPTTSTSISYEDVGVGMLQDAIWADGERLANDPAYQDIATRFVAASIEGWACCRDNPEDVPPTSWSPPARSSAPATSCGR